MITNTEFKRVKSSNYPHIEKDDETFCKWSLIFLCNKQEVFKASYEADIKTQDEFKARYNSNWFQHLELFALSQCSIKLPGEIFTYRKKLN